MPESSRAGRQEEDRCNNLISNGAFLLGKTASNSVMLERADQYWGRSDVNLERVTFVGTRDPETALAAYHAGEIDAVTNAPFEPLALKLLAPYADYHRTTYGALTYYSFNTAHRPFDDIRVREALAIAIDRERISREEMGGATEPALQFYTRRDWRIPGEAVVSRSATLDKDLIRAGNYWQKPVTLTAAGFHARIDNRATTDQQRQVAEAIATMWRMNLNLQTEIVIKAWDDYEAAIRDGDYDLARRGIVMQTTDESTNIRLMFAVEPKTTVAQVGVGPGGSTSGGTGRESTIPPQPFTNHTRNENRPLNRKQSGQTDQRNSDLLCLLLHSG